MEPQGKATRAGHWIATAVVGVAIVVGLAIVLGLGPFADEDLSEAEFLAQGDEICAQAHSDYEDLQRSLPVTSAEATELTEELVAISRDELDAIAELAAPDALDPEVERYLRSREGGIELLREGLAAAERSDAFAYEEAQADLGSGQPERARLARQVGFDECSRILFGRDQLERDSEPPASTDPGAPPTIANPPTGAP